MLARFSAALLWISALVGGAMFGLADGPPETSRLAFLSVGQGDCTVIRHAGYTILFDAGPASDSLDAGSRWVAPKLKAMGARRVDLLILTHPDLDHIGGLPGLSSRLKIGNIAIPAYFREHPDLIKTLAAARIDGTKLIWIDHPIRIRVTDMAMEIRLPNFQPDSADNEGSPFIRVDWNGSTVVLTGDASEETEIAMMGRADWESDILKAGHHGSASSTSEAWLNRVRPDRVIASCGINNRFGHPANALIERVKNRGIILQRTDQDGDLVFEPRDKTFVQVKKDR